MKKKTQLIWSRILLKDPAGPGSLDMHLFIRSIKVKYIKKEILLKENTGLLAQCFAALARMRSRFVRLPLEAFLLTTHESFPPPAGRASPGSTTWLGKWPELLNGRDFVVLGRGGQRFYVGSSRWRRALAVLHAQLFRFDSADLDG